jgi:hypothetical protein
MKTHKYTVGKIQRFLVLKWGLGKTQFG